jgi:antitoxin HicB
MEKIVYGYTAVFHPEEGGGYSVTVPALPGAISQGDTLEEARDNIREATLAMLESRRKRGLSLPTEEPEAAPQEIREKVVVEFIG